MQILRGNMLKNSKKLEKIERKEFGDSDHSLDISIIITAWKEPETIKKAIGAILEENIEQVLKANYEIIVVVPDQETINSAKSFEKNNKNKIKIIKDPCKGKPIALNLALEKARGKILILTDGDVYISKGAIKKLLEPFQNKEVGEVTGHPVPTNERNTMLDYWSHLLTEAGAHRRRLELKAKGQFISASGYLCAIRNGIFTQVPENILSDDAFISNIIAKAGYKIDYAPEAIVNVKFPNNFNDWIKQKKRSAGGYNQLKQMLGEGDKMRSFTKESSKIIWALTYPRNIKEFIWTIALVFARIYLWIIIFIDINLKRKSFKETWVRIESTK